MWTHRNPAQLGGIGQWEGYWTQRNPFLSPMNSRKLIWIQLSSLSKEIPLNTFELIELIKTKQDHKEYKLEAACTFESIIELVM